jgi:hypothetical protein
MRELHIGNWSRESRLPVETLESLRELNHRFLELLCARSGDWRCANAVMVSPELPGRLAPLSPAQRRAIADCPYALFDLRFGDDHHWCARLVEPGRFGVCDDAARDPQTLEFVRLALFFAWHVASTARLAARFLLGMNENTVAAFRGSTIDCLPALAAAEADTLSARWNDCPAYWDALTRAACRQNPVVLRRVQLSGLQLAAAVQLG